MRKVELALKAYLASNNLSAYRLAQATKGRVSERTIYSLARGGVSRIDLGTLGRVLTALETLTGHPVGPVDLLGVTEVDEPDAQTEDWQAAPLMPELEPYDWGEAGEPAGEAVRYVPGRGFVVGEA